MITVEKYMKKGNLFIEKFFGTQFRLVIDLDFEQDRFFLQIADECVINISFDRF